MSINVIGLLNIAIEEEEYKINEHLKLVSREFFEKQNISMPPDIRFYKTFIISTYDFGSKLDMASVPNEKKDAVPTFFLWAIKLCITEYEIVNSEWFAGSSYNNLREFVKISEQNINLSSNFSDEWINSFKIDNIVHSIDQVILSEIDNLYDTIINIYRAQDKSPDEINLHWLYAFTKFQECVSQPNTKSSILHITAALEFLLVNTSKESEFRAAYFTALIYSDEIEQRLTCYSFMTWAYSIRERIASGTPLDMKLFVDKSDLPENIFKLKEIFSTVLLKTIGLTNRELQEKINEMIFKCPTFI